MDSSQYSRTASGQTTLSPTASSNPTANTASIRNVSMASAASSTSPPPTSSDSNDDHSNNNSNNAPIQPASSSYLLEDPKLKGILLSDVGVNALLSRLKQSYMSARELASFLKKRAQSESEHLSDIKKLAKASRENIKKSDQRQGTYSKQLDDILRVNERLGDVGSSYIAALHVLHDELVELAKTIEKSRKSIKEVCVKNEKNVVEAEQQVEKAKSKYFGLCEELERAKTSDPTKKFGFKQKNSAQHEEDLQKKVFIAETEYRQRVTQYQKLRKELVSILRPQSVRELKELILECDSGLSLQLQKYSNLSETLALNNGFIISPLKPSGASSTASLTMKELAAKVDNELDFYNYVLSVPNNKPLNRPVLEFKQHPSLASSYHGGASSGINTTSNNGPSTYGQPVNFASPTVSSPSTFSSNTRTNNSGGVSALGGITTGLASTSIAAGNNATSVASPVLPPLPDSSPIQQEENTTVENTSVASVAPEPSIISSQRDSNIPYPPGTSTSLPVFGVSLEELLDYEGGTVPRVVYQCVGAVDTYGLEVEGIYRTSGNNVQIQEIKRLFDIDSASVDLLHPSHNLNDIHSVASALKLYFRELPDPLLTKEFHQQFITAAKIDNDEQRRDALHAIVNQLPDPNYTTLRYLIFHLYRVQEREAINRMSIVNLGIVWGPTLMATDYSNVAEMAVQGRVIETILFNAYVIFDAE